MAGSNPVSHVHVVERGSIPLLVLNVGFSPHVGFYNFLFCLVCFPKKCVGVPGKATVQSSPLWSSVGC